jgi:hypothetical protein
MVSKSMSTALGAFALAFSVASMVPAQAGGLPADEGSMKDTGYAAPAPMWTGIYIAGGLGYETWSIEDEASPSDLTTEGFFGQARLGYDHQVGNRFLVGVYAEGRLNGISDSFTTSPQGTTFTYDLDSEWAYGLGARAGYLVGDALIYGTGGWARRISHRISIDGLQQTGLTAPDEADEWFYGAGIEVAAGQGLFVGGEVRQHVSEDDDLEDIGITSADAFSGMLSITYKMH